MKYLKPLFDFRSRKINYDSLFCGWFSALAFEYFLRSIVDPSLFYFFAALIPAVVAKLIHSNHPLE